MMTTPTNLDSKHIMRQISPDTVGAEIGIWYGSTSRRILDRGVKHLHMVDPWSIAPYKEGAEHGSYENYIARYSAMCGGDTEEDFTKFYEKVYKDVQKNFGQDERVTIHRKTSKEFFESFEGTLDWIYVDGDHSKEGCYYDLSQSIKIVKTGGKILGDDYKWDEGPNRGGKPGVTAAVKRFCAVWGLRPERFGQHQFMIQL